MGILSKMLSTISGNNSMKVSEQLLFDKVIGFKSVVPGCGASTVLQNVAIALSYKTKFNICVLDTSFLYPMQYALLGSENLKDNDLDALDFADDLSKIVRNTNYQNIYVVHLQNRSIVDMLSGKDTEANIVKLIANLKSYFDIILVDLSYELTNTNIFTAIKCNKIFQVADLSFKCLYHIKKSINTTVTLGVPLAKCNNVIINKYIDGLNIGVDSTFEEAGLNILATIPLSSEVESLCATGKRIYDAASRDYGVIGFNKATDAILTEILEKTPLNAQYIDVSKELKKMEEREQAKKQAELDAEQVFDFDYDADGVVDDELVDYPDELEEVEVEDKTVEAESVEETEEVEAEEGNLTEEVEEGEAEK